MSAMSTMVLSIWELLEEGNSPQYVAKVLDIPVSWVYEAMEMDGFNEEFSPHQTINS